MLLQRVLACPLAVRSVGSWEPGWPVSPVSGRQPQWARSLNSQLSDLGVDPDQGLLPASDLVQLLAPVGPMAWVLDVQVHSFLSLLRCQPSC